MPITSTEQIGQTKAALETKEIDINNPYARSLAVNKLKNHPKGKPQVFATDIDSTITGDPKSTEQLRKNIEENGEVFIEITSRTEEMLISEKSASRSSELGRPKPQLADYKDKKIYVAPETIVNPGLLDPDIIAGSTGTRIFVKQEDGSYMLDHEFEALMHSESITWRTMATRLVKLVQGENQLCELAKIDDAANYLAGNVDVFPPDFRVQLNFNGATVEDKLAAKKLFYERLQKIRGNSDLRKELLDKGLPEIDEKFLEEVLNIRLTDDSDIKKGEIQSYMTPTKGFKARALDYLTKKFYEKSGLEKGTIQTSYFGDSFTDLATGLLSGDTNTFVLAGGSRLSQKLVEAQKTQSALKKLREAATSHEQLSELAKEQNLQPVDFAGEDLSAIGRRLTPIDGRPGHYAFKPPLKPARTLIILDETTPGKIKSESVLAYHQMNSPK